MRFLLLLIAAAAVLAAAATGAPGPRIWVNGPATVQGTGFPPGKVVVSVRGTRLSAVKVVRATTTGRFTARFDKPIASSSCRALTVITAVGANGVRVSTKTGGTTKMCPPPLEP
jgi:hypothetical protein